MSCRRGAAAQLRRPFLIEGAEAMDQTLRRNLSSLT
ncbi:hypothetical protein EV647_1569 [Kribbella sp. VKM Ac-2566]|nr:hypothetical protein EV647_1569 [Kribbella sp. VKM Ac-2566]